MNAFPEPMAIFWAILMPVLGGFSYMAVGLLVLSLLDRHWRIERITERIEGWAALAAMAVWPLTSLWLLWQLWLETRDRA
jgi:hypothetical protein